MSKQPITNQYRKSQILLNNGKAKPVVIELPKAHPKQAELINSFVNNPGIRFVVGACGTKFGKAITLTTLIPTPYGWKLMKDIKKGDYVFDENGSPVLVDFVTDPMYDRKVLYKVTFSDGNTIDVDADHLWETQTHACRKNLARVKSNKDRCKSTTYKTEVVTTQQIKDTLSIWDGQKFRPNHSINNCGPVQFPKQDLLLDPYVLGAWLGDGTSGANGLACDYNEQSIIDEIRKCGFEVNQSAGNPYLFHIQNLVINLKTLGVLNSKHIPSQYLIGSVEQRLALLQGLMDTDGTISKRGDCCFDNTNEELANGVAELCETLGIKVNRQGRVGKLNGIEKKWCYRIHFTTDLPVFRLQRKLDRLRPVSLKAKRRMIVAVEQIKSEPVKCIRVANERHLFLAGKFCVPTHNTYGCCIALVREAWNNLDFEGNPLPGPGLYWWVAPSYSQATNAYELTKTLLPKDTFDEHKATLTLVLREPDGSKHSTIEFKSGDNDGTLRGFAVNFCVIDEAARISEASFISVMTTLTQTMGRAMIISTPIGRGWFYEAYQKGEKFYSDGTPKYVAGADKEHGGDPDPEWMSIRMPTWSNPYVKLESIRQMRKNLPADSFQMEVGAQFLSDSAGVFRNISSCFTGTPEFKRPKLGDSYVIGVDLAKKQDYSVITVMNRHTLEVVYWDRFNQLNWEVQYTRIINTARTYNGASVCMDSTGLGDPILETLRSSGLHVEGYTIGGSKLKQQLIEKLRLNIENSRLIIPSNLHILRRELENYEFEVSDRGIVSYSAPRGQHDDCVISLALANFFADSPEWVYKYRNVRAL